MPVLEYGMGRGLGITVWLLEFRLLQVLVLVFLYFFDLHAVETESPGR